MKKILILTVAVLISVSYVFSEGFFSSGTISFTTVTINPSTDENTKIIRNLKEQITFILNRDYKQFVQIVSEKETDYSLSLNIYIDETQTIANLTLEDTRTQKDNNFSTTGKLAYDTPVYLARAVFLLWSSFHEYLSSAAEGPVYIETLRTESIQETVIPEMQTILVPMDIKARENGNILAAFSMISVEFDRYFRIVSQPGRILFEGGDYTNAAGIADTPGGTIFLKPSMGRYIYKFSKGIIQPEKIRSGSDLYGPFTVLRDGSAIILDIQKRKAFRITGRKKKEIPLYNSEYSYIPAIESGPEGNIWVYDSAEKRIRIHSPEGEIIDTIIPVTDGTKIGSPVDFALYNDGRFIMLFSSGILAEFDRNGIPLWNVANYNTPEGEESFPGSGKITVDSEGGLIYIADTPGRKIIKFSDTPAYSKSEDQFIKLNRTDDGTGEFTVKKAVIYEEHGAYEIAKQLWEDAVEMGYDEKVADNEINKLEVKILSSNVENLKLRTLRTVRTIGHESAKVLYSKTLQTYERILSLDPDNMNIRKEKAEFEQIFNQQTEDRRDIYIIKVDSILIQNIFPSLMQYYLKNPVGNITLSNTFNKPVKSLKVSLFIKDFMDFPFSTKESIILAPGESAEIDLFALFNRSILDLEEDLSVQVQVLLEYTIGEQLITHSNIQTANIYRRSAISWDNSGKLSSFITLNDDSIENFSHHAVSVPGNSRFNQLPEKLIEAIKICDALGQYGIEYVEDPDSPSTKTIGHPEIIDTVRFPRKTLLIHSGDCDDTTSLLASLMESTGIETAVVTSPGHVFIAFNTDEPIQNQWMFSTKNTAVIPYKGTLWLPVETTILNKGFMQTWISGSNEYRKYRKSEKLEFLPVKDLQIIYPPVPLGKSIYSIIEPSRNQISTAVEVTFSRLQETLYTGNLRNLEDDLVQSSAFKAVSVYNRMGVLHARFGNFEMAEELFRRCIVTRPDYTPAYINLTNLYMLTKKTDKIESVIDKLKTANPELALRLTDIQMLRRAEVKEPTAARAADISNPIPFTWITE